MWMDRSLLAFGHLVVKQVCSGVCKRGFLNTDHECARRRLGEIPAKHTSNLRLMIFCSKYGIINVELK